jgi:hypothetical protein
MSEDERMNAEPSEIAEDSMHLNSPEGYCVLSGLCV